MVDDQDFAAVIDPLSIDKIKALLGNTGTLTEQIDESQQTVQYAKQQLQEYTKMTGQN